jgi:uncharacterized membrane protein
VSPATLAWTYRATVVVHIAAVVVWFGAVAYYLFILRPAFRSSGVERHVQYQLIAAIRARLVRVVGVAVAMLVASGLALAHFRGYIGGTAPIDPFRARLFHVKLGVAAVLVVVFLTALPLLRRVPKPRVRGRLFITVHIVVLLLGTVAATIGVILSR